jgi:hypothetical protein
MGCYKHPRAGDKKAVFSKNMRCEIGQPFESLQSVRKIARLLRLVGGGGHMCLFKNQAVNVAFVKMHQLSIRLLLVLRLWWSYSRLPRLNTIDIAEFVEVLCRCIMSCVHTFSFDCFVEGAKRDVIKMSDCTCL